MIEIEEKFLIDYNTYNSLLNEYKDAHLIVQTNHYYMQKNSKMRATIRIREIAGKFLLQVKCNKDEKGSLHIKEEFEMPIDKVYDAISADILKKLTGRDFSDAFYIGSLTTERNSYMYNPTTEICIDKNTYLGVTDYELEVEYTAEFPKELTSKLLSFGIKKGAKVRGKFSRFLKRLDETK